MTKGTKWMLVALVGALAAGCASDKGAEKPAMAEAPQIDDAWLARVPRQNMSGVEEARANKRVAADELNRTKVALSDAENEKRIAEAQRTAAQAEITAGEARLKAARDTGDQATIFSAQENLEVQKLANQAADARVKVADAMVTAGRTRRDLSQARLDRHSVLVEQAEYDALRETGDTRVRQIDPAQFDLALAERRAKESELERKLSGDERNIVAARERWDGLRQQLEARQGVVPAG